MPLTIPSRLNTGNPQIDKWSQRIINAVRSNVIHTSAHIRVTRDSSGQTLSLVNNANEFVIKPGRLPFVVYASGEAKVKVTGGLLLRGTEFNDIEVADSAELTVADGDYVWLERTGANSWEFNKGANLPTDKLYYELAQVAVDGADAVTVTLTWEGGNLIHSNFIRVDLATDGGSGGGDGVFCDFTYTASIWSGACELLTAATPENVPARIIDAIELTAATIGTVRVLEDGTFELWDANESAAHATEESDIVPCTEQGGQ